MGTTNQYYLHGILLNATWVPVVEDLSTESNIELFSKYAGAAVTPSFVGGRLAAPEAKFSTTEIKIILDECTEGDGISMKSLAANNVDLCYRLATSRASRTAIGSGSHIIVRARNSVLFWEQIQGKQGDEATITCRLIPTWDGTNTPLVGLGSQTIAANQNVSAIYTLGLVKLNGSAVDGVQGWTLDNGLDVNIKPSDGETYPRFVGLRRTEPKMTIETPDLAKWVAPGVGGTQLTAFVAYLRKLQPDLVGAYANASAVHVSLTGVDNPCGMMTVENSSGGVANDEASLSLRCDLRRSVVGTTHPLTINTAVAIA